MATTLLQASRYLTGCFYTDESGLFHSQLDGSLPLQNQTSTLQAAVNAGNKSQWLLLVRPQGTMEVRTITIYAFYLSVHV